MTPSRSAAVPSKALMSDLLPSNYAVHVVAAQARYPITCHAGKMWLSHSELSQLGTTFLRNGPACSPRSSPCQHALQRGPHRSQPLGRGVPRGGERAPRERLDDL